MAKSKQVTVRVPMTCVTEAEEMADLIARPGIPVTQSDIFRAAIIRGLQELRRDLSKKR